MSVTLPKTGSQTYLWEEKYHENATESAELDSDSEEVDITESESDEEDPLADILWTHINIILLLYYDSSIDL